MDAKTLYREGITAIRSNEPKRGRDLLMQALKLEPNNEAAWLWLSRAVDDPERKLQCLERALQVNPDNVQTKTLIEKIKTSQTDPRISTAEIAAAETTVAAESPAAPPQPERNSPPITPLNFTADESRAIARPVSKPKRLVVATEFEDSDEEVKIASPFTAPLDQASPDDVPSVVKSSSPFRSPVDQIGETITQVDVSEDAWLDEPIDALTPILPSNHPLRAETKLQTPPPFTLDDSQEVPTTRVEFDDPGDDWLNEPVASVTSKALKREKAPVPANQQQAIKSLMKKAQAALSKKQIDEAIEYWIQVLEIEVDHIEALGNAVRHLSRQKHLDDARELTWNAINAGTTHPSVYMTAIGIADRQGNPGEADDLRLKLAQLPEASEQLVTDAVEHFIKQSLNSQAVQALDYALPLHPKSQKLLVQRAQLAQDMGQPKEALHFYEQAAQLGTRTSEGKLADEQLLRFAPRLSDKERGSMWMAAREAFGFGFVYLLLGWQDAGLNLSQLGPGRLGGVILSIIGGYFVISATSSPQQHPLAKWLGGKVPVTPDKEEPLNAYERAPNEPEEHTQLPIMPPPVRITFGLIGTVILIGAFVLVFNAAIHLLLNPNPTAFYVPTLQELMEEVEQVMR